jgi:hypothetical protein
MIEIGAASMDCRLSVDRTSARRHLTWVMPSSLPTVMKSWLTGRVAEDGEPEYENIIGRWLSLGHYMVVHRLAVSPACQGRGFV